MVLETEFRIVQLCDEDFRIELRRLETFLWVKSWSDWQRLSITHYYDYHYDKREYSWKSEANAREYIAALKDETARKQERNKSFPKIINY